MQRFSSLPININIAKMEDPGELSLSSHSERLTESPVQQKKRKIRKKLNKREPVQDPTIYDLIAGMFYR